MAILNTATSTAAERSGIGSTSTSTTGPPGAASRSTAARRAPSRPRLTQRGRPQPVADPTYFSHGTLHLVAQRPHGIRALGLGLEMPRAPARSPPVRDRARRAAPPHPEPLLFMLRDERPARRRDRVETTAEAGYVEEAVPDDGCSDRHRQGDAGRQCQGQLRRVVAVGQQRQEYDEEGGDGERADLSPYVTAGGRPAESHRESHQASERGRHQQREADGAPPVRRCETARAPPGRPARPAARHGPAAARPG